MLPQKSSYLKKIDELHKQIEELALKLQHVREEIGEAEKRRVEIRENINKLQDKIVDLNHYRSEIVLSTELSKAEHKKAIKEFDAKVLREKDNLKKLKIEERVVKQKLAKYKLIDGDIKAHEARLNGLRTDCSGMNLTKNELSKEILTLNREKRSLEKDIENARGKADRIVESATEVAKDAHQFYQSIGPWISAIAQWHAVNGGKMPELLHDWKPKTIVVSSQIHKMLKDKSI